MKVLQKKVMTNESANFEVSKEFKIFIRESKKDIGNKYTHSSNKLAAILSKIPALKNEENAKKYTPKKKETITFPNPGNYFLPTIEIGGRHSWNYKKYNKGSLNTSNFLNLDSLNVVTNFTVRPNKSTNPYLFRSPNNQQESSASILNKTNSIRTSDFLLKLSTPKSRKNI